MKKKVLFMTLVFAVAFSGVVAAQSPPAPCVWIDVNEIEGLVDGLIPVGSGLTLTIKIRFHNTDGVDDERTAISNGFYFYSENGVTIGGIEFTKNCAYNIDLECAIPNGCYPFEPFNCFSWWDMYFDTTQLSKGLGGVGIAGLSDKGSGLPLGFDDWIYSFTLTGVDNPSVGGSIIIDSAWWAPNNKWLWTGLSEGLTWAPGEDEPNYDIGGRSTDVVMVGDAGVPNSFALNQNYPNPFNPSTTAEFQIARRCHVLIEVYNVLGQPVKTLVNEVLAASTYKVDWDGRNEAGEQVSSGVYLCRMKAGEFKHTIKMMMLK